MNTLRFASIRPRQPLPQGVERAHFCFRYAAAFNGDHEAALAHAWNGLELWRLDNEIGIAEDEAPTCP